MRHRITSVRADSCLGPFRTVDREAWEVARQDRGVDALRCVRHHRLLVAAGRFVASAELLMG